jgi:Prion-inhibition and propagation
MDPTGFAIGVVGLTSLVSTCIEAFQILRAIRAFSRDCEILFTKLDIEKELFLQWAQQVGLLKKHTIDRRLFDQRTDLLIYRVLKEIRLLLMEANGMEGRYSETGVPGRDIGYHYGSEKKRSRHHHDDEDVPEKKVSFARKFIWTVHGRDELKSLIEELSYFIEKLYQMIPSIEQRKASVKELRDVGANAATLSTLMLAGGRDDASESGDWSDLASEVAYRAEERRHGKKKRRRHGDGKGDEREGEEKRRERHYSPPFPYCHRSHGGDSDADSDERRRSRHSDRREDSRREEDSRKRRSGSEVSYQSHRSSASHDSRSGSGSGSYKSSRSTLVEMFGDMAGGGGRSGFR